ncbi:class I tRNA ligase family protein [Blattabacterium cuenoti]|uniref:class I tRNA ligase family protein n=1 Tax=Blattabacterium cuenoti TaxID=1653831 RepID=UPI00163C0F07|nr:class I tRNA ligase family protein [Blattabacterium cuenoti]
MEYNFKEIEKKWRKYWKKNNTFRIKENQNKKYYILNMFPYPSGSGLHIGHCLGYISSDIYARYKRLKGYNVLNPMGFDSFGLPTEQYAIQTGKNPYDITYENEKKYKDQIDNIGISFDWSRKLSTSNPMYYRWTQWMFIQIFNSWYDLKDEKAKPIKNLINEFEKNGNYKINAYTSYNIKFHSETWKNYNSLKKETILQYYRLAFLQKSIVNWCNELGTVLANDEINNGKSIRGGHPIYKKKMLQWHIRTTAYSNRLIKGLNYIKCSKSLKKSQLNWIGKSKVISIFFDILNIGKIETIILYPELIFGITFITLSKNHFISKKIFYKKNFHIDNNLKFIENSVFTNYYAIHPITNEKIPIFISDFFYINNNNKVYLGIPGHDKISKTFSSKLNIKTINVLKYQIEKKNEVCINSNLINGLNRKEAKIKIIDFLLEKGIGKMKIIYKMYDAVFSRQRYWGEPIPIYFKKGIPIAIPTNKLPIILPKIKNYHQKNKDKKSVLYRSKKWAWDEKKMKIVSNHLIDEISVFPIEINTMPCWAGSSWYFLRYMDINNNYFFLSKEKENYWKNVDLYIGGSEHNTGHLIYARFWNKFLKDRGWIKSEEPFKKIINQGMILHHSVIILKVIGKKIFISYGLKNYKKYKFLLQEIYVDISLIIEKENNKIDLNKFKKFYPLFHDATFILEKGIFFCKRKLEKMSKSKYNVIKPDDISEKYGADVFRIYEMFLGPITQSKIWDEEKINGIKNFIKKFWGLYHENGKFNVIKKNPTINELKLLNNLIKKIDEKIESYSFNTCISFFMIFVKKLIKMKCNKIKILEPLVKLISPFAPYISEEIWRKFGKKRSIMYTSIPNFESKLLLNNKIKYIIMFNGKLKFIENFDSKLTIDKIKNNILNHPKTKNILKEKKLKKLIIIPKKIINILY